MRIAISDIHVRKAGHNLGYIQNILGYLENHQLPHDFLFILNPEAKNIPSIQCRSPRVQFKFLSEEEFRPYQTQTQWKGTSELWKSIVKYSTEFKADKLILTELDLFQHTVGLSKTPFSISGIIFRPYPRVLNIENTFRSKISWFIRRIKKITTTWLMCRNSQLKKAFILNDKFSVEKMNRQLQTTIFTYLPDPIFDYPAEKDFSIREIYQIPPDKKIFLVFGYIDGRKNVVNILNSMKNLTPMEASQCSLLIAGTVDEKYETELQKSIKETANKQSNLLINVENRFVTDAEMECFVGQSDVIMLPYVNFYSSSGVIGLASRHNKPVVATKFGIIGSQTEEYGLGVGVNPLDNEEITKAIRFFLISTNEYPKRAKAFVDAHTSQKFIETLLEL